MNGRRSSCGTTALLLYLQRSLVRVASCRVLDCVPCGSSGVRTHSPVLSSCSISPLPTQSIRDPKTSFLSCEITCRLVSVTRARLCRRTLLPSVCVQEMFWYAAAGRQALLHHCISRSCAWHYTDPSPSYLSTGSKHANE